MKESDEILTLEEQKQIIIDNYINLMRIKAHEQGTNKELEYQIKYKSETFNFWNRHIRLRILTIKTIEGVKSLLSNQ